MRGVLCLEEQDANYSARSFMRWVKLEATAPYASDRTTSEVKRAVEAA